jgi:hypothetical protein
MSLPIKRKRESLPEPSGTTAGDSSNLERGEHIVGGRSRGRGLSRGRGRDRGRSRGRSFHIPRNGSKTAILTEIWNHRTHDKFTISSQFGPVPPPPTGDPNNLEPKSPPSVTAEAPQLLHSPNWSHEPGDFFNPSDHQNASPTRPQKVDLLNGRPKQIHRNKRQNQASTWTNQMIPLLIEPFMDLLRRTKGGREPVSPPVPNDAACSCRSISLKITCVFWDR